MGPTRPIILFVPVLFAGWLSAWSLPTVSGEPLRSETPLPPSDRPMRMAGRLEVNPLNHERVVVRGKCEDDGMSDIRALMIQSRIEELWVFVPGRSAPDCVWIEIGEEARAGEENTTVTVDWDYLESLMARFDTLYIYHFHPLAYFERCRPGPGCNSFSVPVRSGVVSQALLVTNLQFAMPSAEDIYFMSESSWRMDHKQPKGGTVRHRVVTPYGVVEYGLSNAGKKKYADNRGSRMEGLYIKLVAANSLAEEHILGVIEQTPANMSAALEALVDSMNSRNLEVTLVPVD